MRKYIFILVVFVTSCIEPIDVTVEGSGSNLLVVEGSINTGPGPYTIQLTRTAKYGPIDLFGGFIERETGARVSIRDDQGNTTFLEDIGNGVYESDPSFRGEVGRSYILQIETANGQRFNSVPERIVPVPKIDSLYATQRDVFTDNPLANRTGLQVFAEFEDNAEVDNFYLWTYRGHFKIIANPELNIDPETGAVVPLDCCEICWASEAETAPNIYKDNATNGLTTTAPIGFIEDDGVRFEDKYMIAVNQFSLTSDAYNFYQLVAQQLSIDGDIFDPPPATVRGNIINLDNPDENVIGFFRASDVSQDTLFLFKSQLVDAPSKTLIRGDCRNFKPNATTTRPDFWF